MMPRDDELSGLFVTGTDTGVGKTRVVAAIARRLRAEGRRPAVLKPVASSSAIGEGGASISEDTAILRAALDDASIPPERITPIALPGDLAPSVAARLSGRVLRHSEVMARTFEALDWWADRCDGVVVEGVGGFLCPLAEDSTVADLAIALDFPVLIVARRGLGTLNHTMLTVEAVLRRGLRVAGVVLNGSEPVTNAESDRTNPGELARRLGAEVPILAVLPHVSDPETLIAAMDDVGWYGRLSAPSARGVGRMPEERERPVRIEARRSRCPRS